MNILHIPTLLTTVFLLIILSYYILFFIPRRKTKLHKKFSSITSHLLQYAKNSNGEGGLKRLFRVDAFTHQSSIERLFARDGLKDFVERYVVFGSKLYFKTLELKSKEAREEWSREAVYHSRNIRSIKK